MASRDDDESCHSLDVRPFNMALWTAGLVATGIAVGYAFMRRKPLPLPLETEEPPDEPIPMASLDATADRERLLTQYASMESGFMSHNLDTEGIAAVLKYYKPKASTKRPSRGARVLLDALTYVEIDGPASAEMCRLVVLPMEKDLHIAQRLFAASNKVLDALPSKTQVFVTPAQTLHVTLFHMSRVETPYPRVAENGDSDKVSSLIEKETAEVRDILESSARPRLVFERVILAESGVLIAAWLDETEAVAQVRRRLRTHCPNAPQKQTNIIHTSLFRILTPAALSSAVQGQLQEVCRSVSSDLAELKWTPKIARIYRDETHFSTVTGPFVDVPLLNAV